MSWYTTAWFGLSWFIVTSGVTSCSVCVWGGGGCLVQGDPMLATLLLLIPTILKIVRTISVRL